MRPMVETGIQRRMFMRTLAIAMAAAVWIAASAFAGAADEPHRPNIVFIYADDWRWDCLGVVQREQGDKARFPWLQTPRLDKLAQESIRFRQSFVVNSLCSPGRACVLTSRYSHLNGIIGNSQPFPLDAPTFSKQLQKAAYKTGYCGKFHMDSQRERPGFDFVASFIGQGKYFDCPILFDGKQTPTEGWIDDVSTDYAVKFLGEQLKGKPFFLWLGFKSPHGPRGGENLPERFRGLYADAESRDVPNLDMPAIFNVGNERKAGQATKKNRGAAGYRAYMQHITAIDEEIGRVVDALEKNNQWDNTVVIVASDNGYYLGEHQLGDKRSAYDESLRVPLLVRMPGKVAPGPISDAMVLNIDYAPTILDIAKAEPLPGAQGRSLLPILTRAEPGDWRTSFFYEYFKEAKYLSPTVLALRTATQKLITYPGHDEWTEVYDLANDPYEIENLAGDQALVKKLQAEFDTASRAVAFRMPEMSADEDGATPKRGQGKRRKQ
jgi:arylsulfatase A-like enzyme